MRAVPKELLLNKREIWFVGKDVATALGYADTFGAIKKHVDDEDKQNCQNDSFESPRGLETSVIAKDYGKSAIWLNDYLHKKDCILPIIERTSCNENEKEI